MTEDGDKGRSTRGKTAVIGAVERKGNVVARVIGQLTAETVDDFVQRNRFQQSELVAHRHVPLATMRLDHDLARRGQPRTRQYVVGAIHTNTIEGFWSILKRGVVGTYHKVSRKYLPLYVAEFQFRYNNRTNDDIFSEAMKGC